MGGDVFSFILKIKKLSFSKAVEQSVRYNDRWEQAENNGFL